MKACLYGLRNMYIVIKKHLCLKCEIGEVLKLRLYIRNIRGILNTSNKGMLLKLCNTVAGQVPLYECKNLFKRSEKRSDIMDLKFSGYVAGYI